MKQQVMSWPSYESSFFWQNLFSAFQNSFPLSEIKRDDDRDRSGVAIITIPI